MNLSKTPGEDLTYGQNFLSKADFGNRSVTKWEVDAPAKTNSWAIAIAVTLFLIFMVLIVYVGWLWYVRDFEENPRNFYAWLF